MYTFENPEFQAVFDKLPEPKPIWEYFLRLMEVPRPSYFPDKIVAACTKIGEELGGEVFVDAAKNIMIRVPATPGLEDKPIICLQGHSDMVCQKAEGVEIDFENDPITPRIDGEWLKAKGTSLGADNGIGVAAGFAVLADKSIKHGPLEILITSDEEVGLLGAAALGPECLPKAKYLVNCDSEEEYAICVGCAGGFTINAQIPTIREEVTDHECRKITLKGMTGGHTGCDIHIGRGNALKLLSRLLKAVQATDYRLCKFQGGSAHNAIPRDATACVMIPKDNMEAFETGVKNVFAAMKAEFATVEKDLTLVMRTPEKCACRPPMDKVSTDRAINWFNAVHNGIVRMSPDVKGLVETSFCCTVAETKDDHIFALAAARSSSASQLQMCHENYMSFCELAGVTLGPQDNPYPGWMPNLTSPLLKSLEAVHKDVCGKDAHIYAIHAGLECGLIMDKCPELDAISIGPTIQNPHSPDEQMLIASVPRFYKLLSKTIESMAM